MLESRPVTAADAPEVTYHLIDERDFRERYFPAVALQPAPGEDREAVDKEREAIVREILDACDAAGPSWTALHKLFDETRAGWLRAAEIEDGEQVQRGLVAGYARVVAHLRPAFCVRGFSLLALDRAAPEVARKVRSPGALLRDPGGALLPGVPERLAARVPARILAGGRSGGGFIPRDEVRPFLDALRAALPGAARTLGPSGEAGLTVLLSALVEAKLQGYGLLEAVDAIAGDPHLPKDHRLGHDRPGTLPPACVREVGKLYGKGDGAPAAPAPAPAAAPAPRAAAQAIAYSPRSTYEVGQRIQHKAFGTGEVTQVLDSRRLKVRFTDDEKTLVQGLPAGGGDGAAPPAS